MKKLNLLSAFMLLFMAIGFTSCDSEPVDPLLIGNEEEPTGPAIFKVDFSGATYTADEAQAVVTGSSIMISGIKTSNGSVFALSVPATTTGTYDGGDGVMMSYKPTLASTFMYMNVDPTLELEDPTGTITITSINTTAKTISGTFNFTGYWSDETANQPNIAFTNGSFQNIPYTGNVGPQPTSLFKVNIDGTLYTADESLATIGEGLISVAGMRGNNGEMVAIIVNATTTGTYTDAAIMAYYESDEDENGYNNFLENPGTVTISNIDTVNNTISGTFSFTGVNDAGQEKVFTNGVFENVPYTTENTSDDVLKATVDGTFIDYANSVAVTFVGVGNDGNIGIVGIGADGAGIRLSISNALAEGIYPISNATDATVRGYFSVSEDNEFAASTGSLTITSKANGRIAGTFQYTVTDGSSTVHQVTTGQFDVEYDW
ncbi:DUF6252 family protein [Flavobacterium sp. MFBS3-15]|uniref:DUF6252 family protein n=1 Tax=Flavobacterium sp. MFBS3-15 TaxID=2989816 RepID=UPI002235BAED|nr:DUF6252 family protein [Flavobacterium sp. MFBS3-15]MCW4468768.1 DUF6252 family protein [Flavobacterium sp. MFBS3-15]